MEQELLRKAQLVQLEIVKEVKRVCEKNHINYFLDAGTLLGAIRHEGFIPWDDDLDIGMLRKDYEKFVKIAQKELGEEYVLQDLATEENCINPFAKVRKRNTLYVEQANLKSSIKEQGVYIDVFPYDMVPSDRGEWNRNRKKMINVQRFLRMKCKVYPWLSLKGKDKFVLSLKYAPFKFITLFVPKRKIREKFAELIRRNQEFEGPYYERSFGRFIYPREYLESYCKVKFEDDYFQAPLEYDKVLTLHFGDYMTPPPESERGDRHHIVKVKL